MSHRRPPSLRRPLSHGRTLWPFLWLLCCSIVSGACVGSGRPSSPPPADVEAARLTLSLSALAAGTSSRPIDTVNEALSCFERSVEPSLRRTLPPEEVLAIEYRFGRLHAAARQGRATEAIAEDLRDHLRGSLGRGPVATR